MKKILAMLLLVAAGFIGVKFFLKTHPLSETSSVALVETEQTAAAESPKSDTLRVDRIHQFFTLAPNKLPIVETITYSPRVDWLEGRAAWVADYAAYYNTSRHFIARSLNGKPDYHNQKVSHGDQFNVFRKDVNFEFYLLVDLTKCEMHFYYLNLDNGEKELIKTYDVGLGRLDPSMPSGSLTPTGKYRLGSKVGIYKPGVTGTYQDNEAEMIQIFGTRWIPIGAPLDDESDAHLSRGCGIHGAPWIPDPDTGELVECSEMIGAHPSSGCVRMRTPDIEELFAIVISKPTTIEIVKNVDE